MENNAPQSTAIQDEFHEEHSEEAIESTPSDIEHVTASQDNLAPSSQRTKKLRKSDCSSDWCTTPPVYFLLCANLFMILMLFILPVICNSHNQKPDQRSNCVIDPFSLLIYSHTLYWFCHLVVDQYLKYHHRRGRLRGYVEFYIQTKNIRRTPFYIISFGNAILLIAVTALHDYCDNNADASCEDKETKVEVLRGLITIQCMAVSFMWVKYIMAVKKFKKEAKPPDLYREDFREQILGMRSGQGEANGQTSTNGRDVAVFPPPEPRTNLDILQIQTELLVYLCPDIGKEPDYLRQIMSPSSYYRLPRQS